MATSRIFLGEIYASLIVSLVILFNHLDPDLLDEVYTVVESSFVTTRWVFLGLKLGLSKNTLAQIEAKHKDDPARCLLECLEKWLQRCDKVDIYGGPTWVALIVALEKLNENTAAGKIEEQSKY